MIQFGTQGDPDVIRAVGEHVVAAAKSVLAVVVHGACTCTCIAKPPPRMALDHAHEITNWLKPLQEEASASLSSSGRGFFAMAHVAVTLAHTRCDILQIINQGYKARIRAAEAHKVKVRYDLFMRERTRILKEPLNCKGFRVLM